MKPNKKEAKGESARFNILEYPCWDSQGFQVFAFPKFDILTPPLIELTEDSLIYFQTNSI